MKQNKKVVEYGACDEGTIVVGQRGRVVPVNHPDTYNVTSGCWATTSKIVSIGEDGMFETLYSVYVKAKV